MRKVGKGGGGTEPVFSPYTLHLPRAQGSFCRGQGRHKRTQQCPLHLPVASLMLGARSPAPPGML